MQNPDNPQVPAAEKQLKVEHIRSGNFYSAHGDVVLSAKWDQYIDSAQADLGIKDVDELWVHFRVEIGQLKYHSKVFADMFSLPTPGSMEAYDGAPLICLPDEGHAVEWLLRFIFRPHELQFDRLCSENALRMKWVMDIAAKYQVEGVRPFMEKQLTTQWPSDLFYWALKETEQNTAVRLVHSELFPNDSEEYYRWNQRRSPDPACAIRIGLDHNIPSILPAAFYRLCQINFQAEYTASGDMTQDWRFKHKRAGPKSHWDFNARYNTSSQLVRWDLVDRDSLYRLGMGKHALQDISLDLTSVFSVHRVEGCTNEDACKSGRAQLEKAHRLVLPSESRDAFLKPNPLGRLREWLQETEEGEHRDDDRVLCDRCADILIAAIRKRMRDLWDDLPLLFHLDSLELG